MIKKNDFPKNVGGALKDALLDASNEKFFECAWSLFDQKPEVKEIFKSTESEVYSKVKDAKLKLGFEETIDDIRIQAEEFYLALGVLIGQKYAVHGPEIQRELGYLEAKMKEAGVLPLSAPIAPR
ncbi:MAG: hypothetical protein ACE144_13970 [Thermodesulfobacteriota bacterium]